MDSRIFVQGLPPNLTDEQLGKHFSMRYQITDAQVIPARRIGFVGFRNYTLAKNAIKYFDKSYMRMHKIFCSMAEPVQVDNEYANHSIFDSSFHPNTSAENSKMKSRGAQGNAVNDDTHESTASHPPKTFQPYLPLTTSSSTSLKRKRGSEQQDDSSLQQYLGVMQTPSKSKTWANEEPGVIPSATPEMKKDRNHTYGGETRVTSPKTHGAQESKDKNAKKQTKKTPREDCTQSTTEKSSPSKLIETTHEERKRKKKLSKEKVDVKDSRKGGKSVDTIEDSSGELNADQYQPNDARTDADWLRSKTSRLLGLIDDDDLSQFSAVVKETIRHEPESSGQSDTDSTTKGLQSVDAKGTGDTKVDSESVDLNLSKIKTSGRLFVRNLPYTAADSDLERLFLQFGNLEEVHVAFDTRSEASKGYAYIQFINPEEAAQAYKELDRKNFQGRLLHILPASAKIDKKTDEYEIAKLPLKKQKQIKRKAEAASSHFSWNSLYMNADAVISSVADRLGISKSQVLDPTSSDAAIKQAHAETHIIQETKAYLESQGLNPLAFKNRQKDDRIILIKNFSYGVKENDLRDLFQAHGEIRRLIMPPSGTMAIVEFVHREEAQKAFKSLAYKKVGESILFLEKAPKGLFSGAISTANPLSQSAPTDLSAASWLEEVDHNHVGDSSTLFIRNLNFSTTTTLLVETFQPLDGFLSAKVKTKVDPKRPGEILSMGFGFAEFKTKANAQAALRTMDGHKLEGHELVVKPSHKGFDMTEERRREEKAKKVAGRRTKIIIKNLPFETSKKDVRALFGAYGQLRSVRVPKKFDSSTRGFAFADFVTAREAENAMDALRDTHLLGRRLVLDFAAEDVIDPEEEIKSMQKKVSRQLDKVALQKLTGSGRKKFNVEGREEDVE